jgi:large repetitive protein
MLFSLLQSKRRYASKMAALGTRRPGVLIEALEARSLLSGMTQMPAVVSEAAAPAVITADAAPDATVAPAFSSARIETFAAGAAGTFLITTSGSPAPALTETGTLPTGVTFVDNGDGTATLSGTPAAGTGGLYVFKIHANNGTAPNAKQTFKLTVDQAPAVTSAAKKTFKIGTDTSFTISTAGFPVAALKENGVLPSGLSFVDNHNGTATLSGTPAAGTAGNYTLKINAKNGITPNAKQTFALKIKAAAPVGQAAAFTSAPSSVSWAAGFSYQNGGSFPPVNFAASGSPTPTFTEIGALPSGVSFVDNGNGTATLMGTPGNNAIGTTFTFTVQASNGVGAAAQHTFMLSVFMY